MYCCYINLAGRADRRNRIEQNFLEHAPPGWQLKRIEAVDTSLVRERAVKGKIRDAEKACFLSHAFTLGTHRQSEEPILILEDDAQFGPQSGLAIEAAVQRADQLGPWDVLYTDIIPPLPETMSQLARLRNQWQGLGPPELLDLQSVCFAGATAYVIHPRAIGRLFDYLNSLEELNAPYDLFLRHLIHQGRIRAWAAFPFPTTVHTHLGGSSIQLVSDERANVAWDSFRRLMWLHRDEADKSQDAEKIALHFRQATADHLANVIQAATEAAYGPQASG
jgi:GR25 family glycosyltransferase involved in LPS biosynthesis